MSEKKKNMRHPQQTGKCTKNGKGRPIKYQDRVKLQCNIEREDKELIFSYFDEFGMSYCQVLSKTLSKVADSLRKAGYDPESEENDLEKIGEKYREIMDSDFFAAHLIHWGFDKG